MSPYETLREGLGALLPTTAGHRLLQAILGDEERQHDALAEVTRRRDLGMSSPREQHAARILRPLLHYAVTTRQWPCDQAVLTTLRAARAREAGRAKAIARHTRIVLDALTRAGVRFRLLKGVPLAWSAYPLPDLRHCHDIDLYTPSEDLAAAISALREPGFVPAGEGERPTDGARLLHARGLPLAIHTTLLPEKYHGGADRALESEPTISELFGRRVPTLPPEAQLLQILGLAALTPQRHGLRWVCDVHFLGQTTRDLSWERFLTLCETARLELPVRVLLGYLADLRPGSVPETVLTELGRRVQPVTPLARDVALAGARAGHGSLALIRRVPGLAGRSRLARWILFPSRDYLRHTAQTGYLKRLARYATMSIRRGLRWRTRPSGTSTTTS